MNSALPFALIIGIDQFAAKQLAEELSKKDMNVVGVGEYVAGLGEINNFELVMDLAEVSGKFSYVFDFIGDKGTWGMEQFRGEKITIVCVNDRDKARRLAVDLSGLDLNWRMVEAEGVYGPGMDEDNFLAEAIKLAVTNQNLVLPSVDNKFRILAIGDLVEAILRASFLSATEKESFLVLGNEINSEEVAKVLIDEAKMTRYKVMQKDIETEKNDDKKLEESVRKLRWEAKISFEEGVVETLQYFFSRADEEGRKKKSEKKELIKKVDKIRVESKIEEKREKAERRMEVVVEEPKDVEGKNEEIENFYKQKKTVLAAKKVEPIQDFFAVGAMSPVKHEEKLTMEEFDDDFGMKPEIKKEETKIEPIKVEPIKLVKRRKKSKVKGAIFLILIIGLILFLPIKWVIITVTAVKNIRENLTLIEDKQYSKLEALSNKNLEAIRGIDSDIDDWGLNKLEMFRNYQSLLKVSEDILKLENNSIPLSQSADLISQAIFNGREMDFSGELEKEKEYLKSFSNEMGLILARLNGDYNWVPAIWRTQLQKQAQDLKTMKEKVDLVSKGIELLPEMLGADGKQRDYLVLFQNEMEIRATGGFIGSYGILSFKNGKLLKFDIRDVYEADGQLKGHVEPPIEIKNYLGEANWFMRDANWNPDFTVSSADIQWFLNQEVNQKVDGVIGINLAVAKAVVGVVGEINLTDFNETITKDNLYEQAEYYSENKFFPGSTQKASFLGTLGLQLFNEIKELKAKQQIALVSEIIDLLEENEIQLALNNTDAARKALDLNWSGAIYQGKCSEENCFSDYLFVVDSNFGVNKANYFLYRSIDQLVDISDISVDRTLKINYENTAKTTEFPGGDYKNYLRVYLPSDVVLSEVSLIDENDSSLNKTYNNDELRIKDVSGKKEIGFLVSVPVLSKKTVQIKYSTSSNLSGKTKFSYVSYVQKQSGFGDTGLTTLVSFPSTWDPVQVEPQASVVGGKLLFNQKLTKDIKLGVEFGK